MASFFAKKFQTYLDQKDTDFVIGGDGSTVMSWGEQSSNNHEEAISLIAHIIKLALKQELCTHMSDMSLYTLTSNLFFKINNKKMVQFDRSSLFPNH